MLQEQFTGYAPRSSGLLEVIPKLAFEGEIDALGFLLLSQLKTVADDLGFTVFPMLSGSEVALLDGTLIAKTLCAFQE